MKRGFRMPAPESQEIRKALARTLAETHLECLSAEHDYHKTLHEGTDFLNSRYGADKLADHPERLDLWSWQWDAMRRAQEEGGFGEIPEIPYSPQMPENQT
jgi:hypothetical protein